MMKPDAIVVVLDFKGTHKHRFQVAAKDFILGKPATGQRGELEQLVEKELKGQVENSKLIACHHFALIKFPVGSRYSRARGAIGVFRYFGSEDELDLTLKTIRKVCERDKWELAEVYTAKRCWFE